MNPAYPAAPITASIALPGTGDFTLLDRYVSGDGFRSDAPLLDDSEVVEVISANQNALGVVDLVTALNTGDDVKTVAINFGGGAAGCVEPAGRSS